MHHWRISREWREVARGEKCEWEDTHAESEIQFKFKNVMKVRYFFSFSLCARRLNQFRRRDRLFSERGRLSFHTVSASLPLSLCLTLSLSPTSLPSFHFTRLFSLFQILPSSHVSRRPSVGRHFSISTCNRMSPSNGADKDNVCDS